MVAVLSCVHECVVLRVCVHVPHNKHPTPVGGLCRFNPTIYLTHSLPTTDLK